MGWLNRDKILKGLKECPICKTNKFYDFQEISNKVYIVCFGCGYETQHYYQSIRAVDEINRRAESGSREVITNKEDNLYPTR